MHELAKGDILVYMDDDDYYPPCRVSHAVGKLEGQPQVLAAGSSMVYLYFNDMETHIRNPGGSAIPKHQDNFYFNLKNALGLTCYVALNQHNSETGGLNYISNSHTKRVISHDVSDEAGFSSFINEETVEKKNFKKGIYKPEYLTGSVTLHHPENIHFANKTSIESPRAFALSVRIFSASEEIDQQGIERYKKNLEKNRD